MLLFLIAAALSAQSPTPIDSDLLADLARHARTAERLDPAWNDQPFTASVSLTPLDEVSVQAAHSPAVWIWSAEDQALYLIIGGPRLAPGNYDDFVSQNLQRYPDVRPLFISVDEKLRKPLDPLDMMMRPSNPEEMARMMRMLATGRNAVEHLTAFSVAVVDLRAGAAAPAPLSGRVVLRRPMSRPEAQALVRDLRLTVEGRLTTDGEPFCGAFNHRRGIDEVTSQRTVDLADTQCFLPARIDRMTLTRSDGTVFAEWPPAIGD